MSYHNMHTADNDLRAMALLDSIMEMDDGPNEEGLDKLAGARISLAQRLAEEEPFYLAIIASHDPSFAPSQPPLGRTWGCPRAIA